MRPRPVTPCLRLGPTLRAHSPLQSPVSPLSHPDSKGLHPGEHDLRMSAWLADHSPQAPKAASPLDAVPRSISGLFGNELWVAKRPIWSVSDYGDVGCPRSLEGANQ